MTENFKVGDKVRRTRDHATGQPAKGYTFKIEFFQGRAVLDKHGIYHDLENIERVEKKPRKLKVGDRVRTISAKAGSVRMGLEFVVDRVVDTPEWGHVGGYYVSGKEAPGGVWANFVERVKPEPKVRIPKLGETWLITQDWPHGYKDVEAKVIEQHGKLRFEFESAYGFTEPDRIDVDDALGNGWTGKRITKAPKSHKAERTDEIQSLISDARGPHRDYTYRDLTDLIKELGKALEAATE